MAARACSGNNQPSPQQSSSNNYHLSCMRYTFIAIFQILLISGCESEREKQAKREEAARFEEFQREQDARDKERTESLNKFSDQLIDDPRTKYIKERTSSGLIYDWIEKTLNECSIQKPQSVIIKRKELFPLEIRNFEIRVHSTEEGLTEADKLNGFTKKHYILFQGSPIRLIHSFKRDPSGKRIEITDLRESEWQEWENDTWRCLIFIKEKKGNLDAEYLIGKPFDSIKKYTFPE